MAILELPQDLLAFFQKGSPATLDAGSYGILTLLGPDELRVVTLAVTLGNAPLAEEDPHAGAFGHYPVPAVNLVRGSPRPETSFPAWLFLWLPNERRYGSFDMDHGDLVMFAPDVRWANIATDPEAYALASEGSGSGLIEVECLRPWPRYEFVTDQSPFRD